MAIDSADTEFITITSGGVGAEEATTRISSRALPEVLPILGLSDIVIYPGQEAPLLVDTPEGVRLIDDVVAGDRLLGVVLQRKPDIQNPAPEDLYGMGCAVHVSRMLKFPDNSVRILVHGLWRIRIKEYEPEAPYLRARFEVCKDIVEESVELEALARNAQNLFRDIIKLSPALSELDKVLDIESERPGRLADIIAWTLNLSLADRQQLLETVSVKERLQRLLPLLNRERQVLELSSKIQSEVAASISRTQRDYFLREQLRAIQRELGETDTVATELKALREQIENTPMPTEARKVALQELERLQQMPPAAAEYAITRHYLDWIVNLPWEKETEDKLDLAEAERILNEQHYGLTKVKDRLLEFLAVLKLRRQIKGPILCLVGPPGVGKTSLGKSVAEALGRRFARFSLGGMRDEAEIRGHRRTYVGALPGRIIQTLRRVESRNPVIMLDELDKVGSDFRGDPAAALLEVLDPAQNNMFIDHYLDLPFDLSRVLFITTANWLEPIHPALRDRLEVIELPSYTESEKLEIAKRYLVPRQLDEHGLRRRDVKLPDTTLRRLIQGYTREAGVRELEREIAALARKAARKLVSSNNRSARIVITPDTLPKLLGQPRYFAETAQKINDIGIAIGLAWTPVGGEVLYIEVTRMPGKGNLLLTGSLGDVMKESAQTAVSYLRSQADALGINLADYSKYDFHVHVPAGATPKDGPSAGVAIVAALASLLTGRRVRSDLAMTGEISLRGRVLRVGGVKEKVLAAIRFGVKHVILPEQNRTDWLELPGEVRKKIHVCFVRDVGQVIQLALEPK